MAKTFESGNLFVTDTLAPYEFESRFKSEYMTPVQKLLFESLKAGIRDAILWDTESRAIRTTGGRDESYTWMFGEYQDYLFSFTNLCDIFKVNQDYVKDRVKKLHQLSSEERSKLIQDEKMVNVRNMTRGIKTKVGGEPEVGSGRVRWSLPHREGD